MSSAWGPSFSLTDDLIYLNMMTAQPGFPGDKSLGHTTIRTKVKRICGEGQQRRLKALMTSGLVQLKACRPGRAGVCAHKSVLQGIPVRDRLCVFKLEKDFSLHLKLGTNSLSRLCSVAHYCPTSAVWVLPCLGHQSHLRYWSTEGCLPASGFNAHRSFCLPIISPLLSAWLTRWHPSGLYP